MPNQIYVNLAVKDLTKTIEFWKAIGYAFDPTFTDDNATCLIIGENIFAMLMTEKSFKGFIKKEICDSSKYTETMLALRLEDRAAVDSTITKVMAAGGTEHMPAQDHGWMYSRSFTDLDGHHWEVFHMDTSKMPKEMAEKKS